MKAVVLESLLAAVLVFSCVKSASEMLTSEEQVQALKQAEELWDSHKIAEYEFVIKYECECSECTLVARRVKVSGRIVTAVEYADDTPCTESDEVKTHQTETINDMFALIKRSLNHKTGNLDQVQITYDSHFGFPSHIFIDPSAAYQHDNYGITITDFNLISQRSNH